jgi:hypothetical protein
MIIGRIAPPALILALIRPACAGHLLPAGEGIRGAVAPLSLCKRVAVRACWIDQNSSWSSGGASGGPNFRQSEHRMQNDLGLSIPPVHGQRLGEGGFGNRLIANLVLRQRYSLP